MQGFNSFAPETTAPVYEPATIDFTNVKGVYKNCRGIWAAQWTDEKGQRHTKYFNPKFFANEQTARVEAYKFKIAIQREIEAKGGVQRKRPHAVRARQTAGRRSEYEYLPAAGRRIRRSGSVHIIPFSSPYCPDFSNASPELLAMLQSVNVAGLSGDPAVTEPILSWQSGMMMTSSPAPAAPNFPSLRCMNPWQPQLIPRLSDTFYRTGESVDAAQLSERMLEGFESYWASQPWGYANPQQFLVEPQAPIFETASMPMEMWWTKPDVVTAVLSSEPLRASDEACLRSRYLSAPPKAESGNVCKKLNEHPMRHIPMGCRSAEYDLTDESTIAGSLTAVSCNLLR